MNYQEFEIYIDGEKNKIYIQPGFFERVVYSALHNHRYTEIQLVEHGEVQYQIGDRRVNVKAGQFVVIPAKTFHECYTSGEGGYIPFQIDRKITEMAVYDSDAAIFAKLREEIRRAQETGECGGISAWLTLICGEKLGKQTQKLKPMKDRKFIIHEYFSHNYNKDITLTELAGQLELSVRQTERLILEETGCSFREFLVQKRLEAARYLMETEQLSMNEVAQRVGYHSYSGFWRAFHKKE